MRGKEGSLLIGRSRGTLALLGPSVRHFDAFYIRNVYCSTAKSSTHTCRATHTCRTNVQRALTCRNTCPGALEHVRSSRWWLCCVEPAAAGASAPVSAPVCTPQPVGWALTLPRLVAAAVCLVHVPPHKPDEEAAERVGLGRPPPRRRRRRGEACARLTGQVHCHAQRCERSP